MNLINVERMAKELGSTKEGVYARMKRGQLPAPLRIGDTPYWRSEDWHAWLKEQARSQGALVREQEDYGAAPVPSLRRRGRPRKEG